MGTLTHVAMEQQKLKLTLATKSYNQLLLLHGNVCKSTHAIMCFRLTLSQLKDEDDPQKLQKSVKKLSLKKLTR